MLPVRVVLQLRLIRTPPYSCSSFHSCSTPTTQAQVEVARARVVGMLEDAIKDYFRKKFRTTYPVRPE
jgi:hypothetical protein